MNFRPSRRTATSWLALLCGAALLPFTYFQSVSAIAAVLAPGFVLHFARSQRSLVAIPGVLIVSVASMFFAWHDVFPPTTPVQVLTTIYGVAFALPYLIDRTLVRRLDGWLRLMVFPLLLSSLDWALSFIGPFATWGSPAYSQSHNLLLLHQSMTSQIRRIP